MKIAILGASGYIGTNLLHKLLSETDHEVVALSLNAESINHKNSQLTKRNVDVFDTYGLQNALQDCDVAYYFIHMMAQKKFDFVEAETKAAMSFSRAAKETDIKRVIYLGGLGNDKEQLSKHLASRHRTGELLRENLPQVIEFRASMVIGKGSISYDIVTNLVDKLPVLTLPKWAKTLTQPIGLQDALQYLVQALELKANEHQIVEIGGPEKLSYGDLMRRYADWQNKKMLIVKLHLIPVTVAAWWLNLFTPKKHAKVGRVMVNSLSNPMIVTNNRARELFPNVSPKGLDEVFV